MKESGKHIDFQKYWNLISDIDPIRVNGKVSQIAGLIIEGNGPLCATGNLCKILSPKRELSTMAEVVGFRNDNILLMPLGEIRGIGPGSIIESKKQKATVNAGSHLLGRILDGLGNPIDGKGPTVGGKEYQIYATPINPLHRKEIVEPLDVGVRAINGLLTCGKGQRIGILAGSGVGKSMLLGMIARNTKAQVNVIALIGERGREVKEFIDRDLGKEGLEKSVVVVATSDQSPLIRMRGAFVATAIAEFFRDQGRDVILMMDSVTRFAMAQREVGLSVGEPPTTKGYTPSVFAMLPKLLERAGTMLHKGSITGLYTVLVEGDDMNEPIADSVRAILDGHIVLSRELASHGHYPPIDILNSLSRLMINIVDTGHLEYYRKVVDILATHKQSEDLINIGAYVKGTNSKIDYAVEMIDKIKDYLKQEASEMISLENSIEELEKLFT